MCTMFLIRYIHILHYIKEMIQYSFKLCDLSKQIESPFELTYFWVYVNQLMQINKFLCIFFFDNFFMCYYKFLKVVMRKQLIKI
jgi:hypothetical protein